ncbi:MAG: hypothetical protein EBU88_08075, partial [Acidobacteria bacterium]|nr:hypothetical protein [Acidobacteriota bacterium]
MTIPAKIQKNTEIKITFLTKLNKESQTMSTRAKLLSAGCARRQFIRQSLGAGIVLAAPAYIRGRGLNDKLNLAIIGAGGRGGANLKDVETENIAILCDVNEEGLRKAAERHPKARL